ncbi:MAG TPA: hypothetical protein V6C88_05490 [Chroococcidiopsis sp.]
MTDQRYAFLAQTSATLLITAICTLPMPSAIATPTSPSSTVVKAGWPASTTATDKRSRTATLSATLNVEGEETPVQLNLFDRPELPFTTYLLPREFTAQVGRVDELTGARFYWTYEGEVDQSSYVQFAFPASPTPVSVMEDLILSDGGLVEVNGWNIISEEPSPYPWAQEAIIYEETTDEGVFMGAIYIGTYQAGKSFYVLTHYPIEYGDGFEPRADLILRNVEMR